MIRFTLLPLLCALGCTSSIKAKGTSATAPATARPAGDGDIGRLKIVAPVYNGRNSGRSVSLEAFHQGDSWSWQSSHEVQWYGDNGRRASLSRQCSPMETTSGLSDLAKELATISLSDHERRGGSGNLTIAFDWDGDTVRTQIRCDLEAASGTGLCGIAQQFVEAYLIDVEKSFEGPASGVTTPMVNLELQFAERTELRACK